jgi:hypothetical protein
MSESKKVHVALNGTCVLAFVVWRTIGESVVAEMGAVHSADAWRFGLITT